MLPLGLSASDRDPRIMAPLMASQNKVLVVFCTKGWGKGTRMTSCRLLAHCVSGSEAAGWRRRHSRRC